MAGIGKRMRPHTLSTPKPLIPIAGKSITERLVEEILKTIDKKIENIGFIIGDFGEDVEKTLLNIADKYGAKGRIFYQKEALGTAHAIFCAEPLLTGKVLIAFADTLFDANFKLDEAKDATIWTHKVENPESFGVVKTDKNNLVSEFIEKPKEFVSDLAIIGIYYFKDGSILKNEIKNLIDNKVLVNNEYQITDALENMKNKGIKFSVDKVDQWLDCGNKNATIFTNQRILELKKDNEKLIDKSAVIKNSNVIHPCYIGKNVFIENSVIGPYASIGDNSIIKQSIISNSIIQSNTKIELLVLEESMIGSYSEITGHKDIVNVGDYCKLNSF